MNFKKTIAKSLVVAMALGMVPVANLQTAKAAANAITFEGATGIAKSTGAKFWGVAKVDAKGGKGSVKIGDKSYKITNIQEYADEIDAYGALKGKAGVLAVGDKAVPDGDWKVLELPAAETTFKVQLVASTAAVKGFKPANQLGGEYGYLVASIGKQPKEVGLAASKGSIEVKLNDGNWSDFATFFGGENNEAVSKKLKVYGQNGSTLTFRLKGTAATWASKESKVKVAAQAKAPAVKIDITKETTSIKTGMEYQIVAVGGDAKAADWKASTEKKGISLAELKLTETKDVLVRTAATAKKLASKVARITVNKPADALTIDGGKFESTGAAIKKNNDVVAVVESNLAYDITKGASLKNVGTVDLEYTLVADGTTADKIKWSTLKASKDPVKKPSKATLKYSATTKANTWGDEKAKLFVRLAGTKQTKENIATQSGVSAGAVMALSNIAQKFEFTAVTPTDAEATKENATTASIKVATGTAAVVKIEAKVTNVVNPKGGSLKIKATKALPKGVTIKAGKVDPATGKVEITVNISKGAFKTEVPTAEAEYSLGFEGIKDAFKIKITKKA